MSMQMVPQEKPAPRLLNTVVPDFSAAEPAREPERSRSALLRERLFSGNGLAIFAGLLLGSLAVAGAGWLYERHSNTVRAATMFPVLVPATTRSISSGERATPAPIMVQIGAEHIRVTAISLGHPRLAVINGQQVGEGDFVSVHAPTVRVEVKLRVLKIADGRIDLSDGSQTITARLAMAAKK